MANAPDATNVPLCLRRALGKRILLGLLAVLVLSCGGGPSESVAVVEESTTPAYRIYVTNEASGDLSIIDSATMAVVSTVPLGKRPRGIHASPDGETIYVAWSGSPPAPPGVDESTLPPPDRSADGIGVVDVSEGKLVKVVQWPFLPTARRYFPRTVPRTMCR